MKMMMMMTGIILDCLVIEERLNALNRYLSNIRLEYQFMYVLDE